QTGVLGLGGNGDLGQFGGQLHGTHAPDIAHGTAVAAETPLEHHDAAGCASAKLPGERQTGDAAADDHYVGSINGHRPLLRTHRAEPAAAMAGPSVRLAVVPPLRGRPSTRRDTTCPGKARYPRQCVASAARCYRIRQQWLLRNRRPARPRTGRAMRADRAASAVPETAAILP